MKLADLKEETKRLLIDRLMEGKPYNSIKESSDVAFS